MLWIRIMMIWIRIRIQLLVKDFCEFYFPCYVFPSLYFRFLKRLLLYIINLIKNCKKLIFSPLYFGCSLCYPDPFSPSRCGSGSGQMMWIRPDPNPQHWIVGQKSVLQNLCSSPFQLLGSASQGCGSGMNYSGSGSKIFIFGLQIWIRIPLGFLNKGK